MDTTPRYPLPPRALWIGVVLVLELVAVVLAFQVLTSVECRATGLESACRALRGVVVRAFCLALILGVYLWARRDARQGFADMTTRGGGAVWAAVHLGGLALIFLPLGIVPADRMNAAFGGIFPALVMGAVLAGAGGLFWLARPVAWARWLRGRWAVLLALAAIAMLLPEAVGLLGPLWYWDALTRATFLAVALLLALVSGRPHVQPDVQIIGVDGFRVAVADSCSGIEGFVLITAFLALYAWLFRDTLRAGRFWLAVLPVALALSWTLNVLRIAVLILIGAHVSPELAVNGFHSFAGWLFFAALSIGVLVAVSRSRWLHAGAASGPRGAGPRLGDDDMAARILPFIVFMLSGVVAQAFWRAPELAYPLQAAAMVAALWYVRRPLAQYLQPPGGIAVPAGLAVGAAWVVLAPAPDAPSAALAQLPAAALVAWAAVRILGTVALVPLIEELFFRGYVQARIDTGGWPRRVAAVGVSAGLFALLHGRWLEAGLAGTVFSLLYIKHGRLADAIAAHAIANAVIAGFAAWRGDWSLV
ncbi:exosortase E/protease, VPEID-CTERM system [Roseovarius salinarum]|uniref:exosortase E/protease, VPEID-CTERM system n=1 Tax=Roseovarius salinarum TaxID=1981892 RepID=UPI000C32D4C6|nr:exosortase E/protease, VPEID-CTERM system [Roseovarius salinarum]